MHNGDIDAAALRCFCALMDERSVSRAAARLSLKQPTMSRMLARLREYFGDPLLLWAGGHMVPTPRALQVESEVRELLAMFDRIKAPAQSFDPATTEVRIKVFATGYMENIFLSKVLSSVAAQAPACRVDILLPDRLQETEALEKGQIDFLVGWNLIAAPIFRSRALFTDKLVCIARPDHPEIGDSLSYEEYINLGQVVFNVPGRTTTVQLLQERLERSGRQLDVHFQVQNFHTVAEVVANSNLIATLSNRFVRTFLAGYNFKIFDLPIRLPPMQNRIFWHERMQSDPVNRWFRNLVAAVAKTM